MSRYSVMLNCFTLIFDDSRGFLLGLVTGN